MIKIAAQRKKQKQIAQKLLDLRVQRMRQQLAQVNYDISDDNCSFFINDNICVKDKFIAIQIRAQPRVGLYESIQFKPVIYFELESGLKPPKIINDRRIFHPNIDSYSAEIIVPELLTWTPSYDLVLLMRKLKYLIIEPNSVAIPNNKISKKAAYLYKINRSNFRNQVIRYCPAVLDQMALKQYQKTYPNSQMQDQNKVKKPAKKYVTLSQIMPLSRLSSDDDISDEGFDFLNKKISKIHLRDNSSKQNTYDNILGYHNKYDNHTNTNAMMQQQ